MHIKFWQKTILLLGCIGILLIIDMIILQGGVFVKKIGVLPARAGLAVREAAPEKTPVNLKITSFNLKLKASSGAFKKGETIEATCTIENDSDRTVSEFHSVIRTHKQEIMSLKSTLKKGESVTLKGEFTPQETGILVTACRADLGDKIKENNENDNREIVVLSISR